jgi:hypothetical protein
MHVIQKEEMRHDAGERKQYKNKTKRKRERKTVSSQKQGLEERIETLSYDGLFGTRSTECGAERNKTLKRKNKGSRTHVGRVDTS